MPESEDVPSTKEQKRILQIKLMKSVKPGETWFLVDQTWMKSLREFLGMQERRVGGDGFEDCVFHPGPINNRPLLSQAKTLKKGLVEKTDFEFVSEDTWKLLREWYGIYADFMVLPRKAVESQGGESFIEVYPVELRCFFGDGNEIILKVSRADTVQSVAEKLKDHFDIPQLVDVKLWKGVNNLDRELLDLSQTIEQADVIGPNHFILLETVPEDEDPVVAKSALSRTIQTQTNERPEQSTSSIAGSSPTCYIRSRPGICGLFNLGNTCFMNSVLQCMSNVPPITEYFLSQQYLKELNETNPLGMRGEIAKSYGELIGKMWSGRFQETSPAQFKVQVGKFNPTFNGYQQHDSQELLTFLMDGLHEDLNRIKKKPYIEIVNQAGRDDYVAAAEAWKNYKLRNDSIIVDTFHGLLKSTVICPECNRVSVTFDPFCYLSLPLPYKLDRPITVTYIPFDGNRKECKYKLMMAKKDTIRELCRQIAARTRIPQDHMVVAELSQSHFHKFYGNEDSIDNIDEKDLISVFELPIAPSSKDIEMMIVPVCFWEFCKPAERYSAKHLFGIPFLITIPKRPITFEELKDQLLQKMSRHFSFPAEEKIVKSESVTEKTTENFKAQLWFKIYYMDPATSDEPEQLVFEAETCNLAELLKGSDPVRQKRKILVLQFTAHQRREYYHEKPPECDVNSYYYCKEEKCKISVSDCMSLFTTCEKLSADDAWYCPICKKHQRATKKFDLWKLPKILIIHLKRFSYTRFRRDKIDALVDFPTVDLSMDKYVINAEGPAKLYDLIAVCNHYGNMGGGHYTAFCRNKDSGEWHNFDDSNVDKINQDKVLTSAAYVLFYMAKEDKLQTETMGTN